MGRFSLGKRWIKLVNGKEGVRERPLKDSNFENDRRTWIRPWNKVGLLSVDRSIGQNQQSTRVWNYLSQYKETEMGSLVDRVSDVCWLTTSVLNVRRLSQSWIVVWWQGDGPNRQSAMVRDDLSWYKETENCDLLDCRWVLVVCWLDTSVLDLHCLSQSWIVVWWQGDGPNRESAMVRDDLPWYKEMEKCDQLYFG